MSMIVGAMYCRNPIIDKEIRFAPCAKHNKGMAVTTPAPTSSRVTVVFCAAKASVYPSDGQKQHR